MQFVSKVVNFFGMNEESYLEVPNTYEEPRKKISREREQVKVKQVAKTRNRRKKVEKESNTRVVQQTQPTQPKKTQKQAALKPQPSIKSTFTQSIKKNVYSEPVKKENTKKENVVTMHQQATQTNQNVGKENPSKIMIVEPRSYAEAMSIAKHVMGGESVLVNFHLLEETQARRIVDFLTGAVYAEDGDIKRVADEIFLCTPNGIEINGTAQSLSDSHMFDF